MSTTTTRLLVLKADLAPGRTHWRALPPDTSEIAAPPTACGSALRGSTGWLWFRPRIGHHYATHRNHLYRVRSGGGDYLSELLLGLHLLLPTPRAHHVHAVTALDPHRVDAVLAAAMPLVRGTDLEEVRKCSPEAIDRILTPTAP